MIIAAANLRCRVLPRVRPPAANLADFAANLADFAAANLRCRVLPRVRPPAANACGEIT